MMTLEMTDSEFAYVRGLEEEISDLETRLSLKRAELSTILRFVEACRNDKPQTRRRLPRKEWRRLLAKEIMRRGEMSRREMAECLEHHGHTNTANRVGSLITDLKKSGWIEGTGKRGCWRFIPKQHEDREEETIPSQVPESAISAE